MNEETPGVSFDKSTSGLNMWTNYEPNLNGEQTTSQLFYINESFGIIINCHWHTSLDKKQIWVSKSYNIHNRLSKLIEKPLSINHRSNAFLDKYLPAFLQPWSVFLLCTCLFSCVSNYMYIVQAYLIDHFCDNFAINLLFEWY